MALRSRKNKTPEEREAVANEIEAIVSDNYSFTVPNNVVMLVPFLVRSACRRIANAGLQGHEGAKLCVSHIDFFLRGVTSTEIAATPDNASLAAQTLRNHGFHRDDVSLLVRWIVARAACEETMVKGTKLHAVFAEEQHAYQALISRLTARLPAKGNA